MKKIIIVFGIALMLSQISLAQVRTSMPVKDLQSGIEKYIKKNFEGYKAVEAFKYAVCYEITIQKGSATQGLGFDAKGDFLTKKTDSIIPVRTRTTIALKDIPGGAEKYVKKNYEGFKISEAYLYAEAFSVKIVKENSTEVLLFDKDGKFEKKLTAPAAVKDKPKQADSVPAKNATKEQPKPADTTKKK